MFVNVVSSIAVQIGSIVLGILAIAGLLVSIYVMRRGISLVIAQLQGHHVFAGEVWTEKEWLDGMRAVHDAKRRGQFIDPESLDAYNQWMRGPAIKRARVRRSRVCRSRF